MFNLLYITMAAGIGIIVTALVYLLIQLYLTKKNRWKITENINPYISQQKDAVTKWIDELDKRLKKDGIKVKVKSYLNIGILIAAVTFFISLKTFKNITASIFLTAAFFIIPEYIISLYEDYRKKKIEDQMVLAIRYFSGVFINTRNVEKSFAAVANKVVDPVGRYFADAYADIITGVKVDNSLASLAIKVDSEYWKMFVQLIYKVRSDSAVISLFPELIERIETHIELSRDNKTSLAGERIIALIVAILPIPVYIIMAKVIPDTTTFIVETSIGRIIIVLVFLSLFIFLILDKLLRRVD